MTDRADPIGIVELGEICARQRALNLDLFERLGALAIEAPAGATQQRLATACHRHAWHAELWARRCPRIPPVDLDAAVAAARGSIVVADADDYDVVLAELARQLDLLADRVDPVVDPSTAGTIRLVRHDL